MSLKPSDMWQLIGINEKSIINVRSFHYRDENQRDSVIFRRRSHQTKEQWKSAIETYVKNRNDAGFNIYTTVNPIKPSATFLPKQGAKAKDIDYRDLLFLDFDRAGDTKSPATDKEVNAAIELAGIVQNYLTEQGWPEPIIKTMSGNGCHLYYDLDSFGVKEEERNLIKSFYKALALEFNNDGIKIDTAVYDLPRLTKWIGTVARKGYETNDRPFRPARLL